MFETLRNAFKIKEIRNKILITIALLLVYRVGCYIPVPGINLDVYSGLVESNALFGIMSSISGGALSNGTLLAMGITPYISASIIMQLLGIAIPPLERLQKQGEEGKKKIAKITRFVTLLLAVVQAIGIMMSFKNAVDSTIWGSANAENFKWLTYVFVVLIFTAGAMFTMWLGELITAKGVGNGISLIIFIGIISTAGTTMLSQITRIVETSGTERTTLIWNFLGFFITLIIIFTFIVFVDLAERKVPVQYAKQVKGRKMYGGQSTFIPIKVNGSGVMPLIFAFAILTFPALMIQLFAGADAEASLLKWFSASSHFPFYIIALALLIVFFAYFYAQIQFNPDDVSRNIQQYGGFIPGIRPGRPTSEYLKKISNRITLFGAIFLAVIAIVPTYIFAFVSGDGSNLMNAFSATGMLIVVGVALEFNKQLESQIMMRQYKGFMK